MLAVTQRHLAPRALHAAHYHLRHVAAVPVPGFLKFKVQTRTNRQTETNTQHRSGNNLQTETDVHDSFLAAR